MKPKSFHKVLAAVLALALIIGLLPATAAAAGPTSLTIAGTDILTAPNYTVSCGEGYAVYDPASNTLTLNNANINSTLGADDSSSGAIMFDGDLNIDLVGKNTITSVSCGISGTGGTLTVAGEQLTINSVYGGIREGRGGDSSLNADITIDGASLDLYVNSAGNFSGEGIHAEGLLSIQNQADVYVEASHSGLIGNGGISISDSAVDAYTVSTEGYQAVVSDSFISIDNSVFNASTASVYGDSALYAGNDLIPSIGSIHISNHSQVTVRDTQGCGIYSWGDITVSDSSLEAVSTNDWGAWAARDLLIEGASTVTAAGAGGGLGGSSSFTLSPPDGQLIDVWTGASREDAVRIEGSPLSEAADLSAHRALYFHSEAHTHTYDLEVVSDTYKISGATCTSPAAYYKSCICGEAGTETFTAGEMSAHNYKDGKCTLCGALDASFKPMITAGADGVWRQDGKDGLSFTSSAAFSDFLKVQVDGKDLKASDYDVREGSTIVTLKTAYLKTLSAGKHTLSIVSSTGTAAAEFTIQAADSGVKSAGEAAPAGDEDGAPQTGDNRNTLPWILVMITAGIVSAGAALYSRKKRI